jgi:glucose-1-phosphate thymidylyltransferase
MRARDATTPVPLSSAQAEVAARGVKAMIPLAGGRPFLDYLLSALADAGITDVCLVIGPEHRDIRAFYGRPSARLRVDFAVQEEALGTANAVLAAESFAGGEPFLVMNSDNYYPASVLGTLRRQRSPALPAFSRDGLLRDGNIPAERIARYALLDIGEDGVLRRIVEKPDAATIAALGDARVSMNVWSFTSDIFEACRSVPMSARGELELPLAVQHAIDTLAMRFTTFPVEDAVLDLSHQSDIPRVARSLEGIEIRL